MVSKNLMAASTKPLILAILASREMYGYQIIQEVIELSSGTLEWSEGMLYPVLHKLERERLVRSQWRISETGRRRKYYRVTDQGLKELKKEKSQWKKVNELLSNLWDKSVSLEFK